MEAGNQIFGIEPRRFGITVKLFNPILCVFRDPFALGGR